MTLGEALATGAGAAAGGPAGAALGYGLASGNDFGLGAGITDAWRGSGLWGRENYRPYQPDPASFGNPYSQGNIDNYGQQAAAANSRTTPYWQDAQRSLADQLAAQAAGQGPSLAQAQFNQAQQQGLASMAAMAGSGATANNPALAARSLANQQANMMQAGAADAGMLRLNEQMAARGMLGNVLNAGQQGYLQGQAQNDARSQYYDTLAYQQAEADRAAQIERERIQANAYGQAQGAQLAQTQGNQQMAGGLLGGITSGLGSAAAALSDERQKKDVRPAGAEVESFLNSLGDALAFRYKDPSLPGAAPGQQVGVMAQDVARTPVGRTMVVPTPNGLALDPARSLGAVLAGQADLNQRMNALEGGMATEQLPPEVLQRGATPFELEEERKRRKPTMGRQVLDMLERALGGGSGRELGPANAGIGAAGA